MPLPRHCKNLSKGRAVEHRLGENFYGRVEFGYAANGDIFGINFQRRHAGVALSARF